MSVLNRDDNAATDDSTTDPVTGGQQDERAGSAVSTPAGRVPRTRTGAAWFGLCTAAAALVVLIVFMLQNTRSVEVTFLWMHGSAPLALALLVAGVGVAIMAIAVGVARTTQLRRMSRRTAVRRTRP
jgi:uncharacterized integral membrane protein